MKNTIALLSALCAALLVVGCFRLPIGYYTFLRIAVFVAAVMLLFCSRKGGITWRHIVNGFVAILFNPIFPVYLHSKQAWVVLDVLAAVWFALQAYLIYVKQKQ